MCGSPSSLPTTVPAWRWSTPSKRHHFASTRKLTPCVFWRVYVPWPARWRWRRTPFRRAQLAIDCIAVKPTVRSIITITLPISFANSARSYISSIVAAVTFM